MGVISTSSAALPAAACRGTRDRVPGPIRAVLVNGGNGNASTGAQSTLDTTTFVACLAERRGCPVERPLVCSTGAIGVPMPMGRLLSGIEAEAASFGNGGAGAARAILTTDLVRKVNSVQDGGLAVGGTARVSGMIDA